jgi:type II secretory pathway pseudopilin PulG
MNRQRGISLIVVLIALVIISFAATALLRSTDTATLIAGNLSFKKAALASGDASTETAVNWLNANAGNAILFANSVADGYYATSADGCDLTGTRTPNDPTDDVDWTGAGANANCNLVSLLAAPAAGVANGYTVNYVVNRMCNAAGDPNSLLAADLVTPMVCSHFFGTASGGSTRVGGSYGNTPLSGTAPTYYRITTRITGPRNTIRYLQAFVVQ